MKIKQKNISIRELIEKYEDNEEEGVFGFGGKLNIRPPYQREFVYDDKKRNDVINTVVNNYPLNAMYWADLNNNKYEIIDGQQRTVSICKYVASEFSFKDKYFHNLQKDQQKSIMDYSLMVYFCSGTDSEKLEWFKTINIAGEELEDQELRNAVFHGSWVTDAKRYFSKTGCPAYSIGSDYLSGKPIRQDYLEIAIKWISNNNINEYMATNQNKSKAIQLWSYYQNVISWIESTFHIKRKKLMKGVPWGDLYNQYKNKNLDPNKLEKEIEKLINDEDVTNQKGIYSFVLTRDQSKLNIRPFSDLIKQRVYEKQKGKCWNKYCLGGKRRFDITEMEADHIKPWSKDGKTEEKNCQMLCKECNSKKSSKY
jgi:hypothetical protein